MSNLERRNLKGNRVSNKGTELKKMPSKVTLEQRITLIEIANSQPVLAGFGFNLETKNEKYTWHNALERRVLSKQKLPVSVNAIIGKRLGKKIIEVNQLLFEDKSDTKKEFYNQNESEKILLITEVLDYGMEVFNNEEEKFKHWLKNPNKLLNNLKPEELLDSFAGIEEIKNALYKIDYGIYA